MNKKNTFFATLSFLALAAPACVFAHATPVSYIPDATSAVEKIPSEISIRFSENIDPNASGISVAGPSGTIVSAGDAHTAAGDRRIFAVPIADAGAGAYRVSWSVVSADDGHFTRGGYVFVVGSGTPIPQNDTSTIELVENTTVPESLGMTVELMGNGLIWATLVLWIVALRKIRRGKNAGEQQALSGWYARLLLLGVLLIFLGGAAQIGIKVASLASLRSSSFISALPLYVATAAGQANVWRLGVAFLVGLITFVFRKKITGAEKVTAYELLLLVCMCAFAYFRAKISHATANPFHPGFSVAVNFLHLIEKDIWAGLTGVLFIFSLSKKLRSTFTEIVPRTFAILAVNLGAVSVTAGYIIWLHLKTWNNLFTTKWGGAFLALLATAVLIVGVRLYHALLLRLKPRMCMRYIGLTLGVEFALGILIVYFSSVVILTSPPLMLPQSPSFSAKDQSVAITLSPDPYEDGMALLSVAGAGASGEPVLTLAQGNGEPLSIELTERFPGGYVFPVSLIDAHADATFFVTAPRDGGYDAHAQFVAAAGVFTKTPVLGDRPLDGFAWSFIFFALAGAALSLLLLRLTSTASDGSMHVSVAVSVIGFVLTLCVVGWSISTLGASALANPFKAQCEADGNMWHLMLPTKAGIPVAQTPQEGCMWGMGQYLYMFPDRHEYSYLASLPKANISLEHAAAIQAGVPTTFTMKLQESDGTPAKLFVDMEKLVHVVIVSQDEKVFAHIHADDMHPLTPEEIRSSTFTFNYTFPKAGTYLVSADYAHGLSLESKQFTVEVKGTSKQKKEPATYPLSGNFGGYDVVLAYGGVALAGEVTTLRYTITKDGQPVTNLEQYLSAAMHVSVVKNDLKAFIHTHGEVHAPGSPYPPIIIKNGQVVHSMAMMLLPPTFGPTIEAHLIFPSAGEYTIWGEFKAEGKVIPTSFTVRVD